MPAPSPLSAVDAVDEADAPVGVAPRARVLADHLNFRTIHIFVFDSDGRLLVQQLGEQRDRHPLRWGSSVAGYVFAGEPEWAAARRRLREELGLRTKLRKHGALAIDDEHSTKFVTLFVTHSHRPQIRDGEHIQRIAFRVLTEVEADLDIRPDDFTPTFSTLFRFFRATEAMVRR